MICETNATESADYTMQYFNSENAGHSQSIRQTARENERSIFAETSVFNLDQRGIESGSSLPSISPSLIT